MIESTNAFKRFANGQSWQQLDYNTQQQIRLMAILEQATAKYGDTLSNSVNGRISLFKSLLKDAALNVGNAMLPVINAMMPALNSLAMVLKNVTAKLAEFIGLMFNKRAKVKDGAVSQANQGLQNVANNAGGAGDAVDDLGDSLGGAGDAADGIADGLSDSAKQAKKATKELLSLAGFDEITTLNIKNDADDDGGSGSGSPKGGSGGGKGKGGKGGGGITDILPEIALEDMDNNFKSIFDGWDKFLKPLTDYLSKLAGLFKDGFNLSFRADSIERFKEALKGIWESLQDIFSDGKVLEAVAKFGEKLAFALGQTTGAIANVIMGIAVFIAESLNKSLNEIKLDIKSWLIRQFEINGDIVASIGNIAQVLGQVFYDTITSIPATDIGSHILSGFSYALMGVADIGAKMARDLFGGISDALTDNQEGLTQALTGLLAAVEPIFRALKDFIRDTFVSLNTVYDEHVKPFIDSWNAGWSQLMGTVLDFWNTYLNPTLSEIGEKFSDMISNHIQPFVDDFLYLFGQVVDFLKHLWEEVFLPFCDWIVAYILPVLLPIIQFFAEGFITAWNGIFDIVGSLLQILGGVIEFITGVFTGDWQKAWDGIKNILSGIWDLIIAVLTIAWEIIVSFFQNGWDTIVRIFYPIGQWFADRWNDITTALSNVGQWISDKFKEGWTGLTNVFKGLGQWFGERWNDVTNALSSVNTWLGDKFRDGYNAIVNIFNGIGSFFSGVWNTVKGIFTDAGTAIGDAVGGAFKGAVNAVLGTIENIVNGFIDMINGVIGLINKIPGVSLGYIGGISLPRLAKGGIVDSATLAIVGEAGKEAVMPLENNTGWITDLAGKVAARMPNTGSSGDGRPIEIIIRLGNDSAELGRALIRNINEAQEQAGALLLNI